ncbi:MAG: branched-chain amino acid ABC transporter permease [Oscillospiraceae bacterium]|nr:branched-chain amino acid ABC transporter permease [Oscillospiraceae bacterium]
MRNDNRRTYIVAACLLFLLLALMTAIDMALPSYHIAIKVIKKASVYALVAVSMNLLNGFTGLFSLGQAGFMLLGAYAYAIISIPVDKRAGVYQYFDGGLVQFSLPEFFSGFLGDTAGTTVGILLALLLGGIIAAIFAYLIGLPVLRLKSDYLAIATLGFAEILRALFQWKNLGPLTNGSNLLKSYPDFENATSYVILIGLFIAVIVLLVNSSYGRAFKAIRDDEVAAEAMGINLAKHKRLAFVISSFFAGIGGGMLAMYMGTLQALSFKSTMTYEILLVVVIGGIGSITGSVITSFIYIASLEWLLRGLDSGTFLGISAPGIFKNGFRMAVVSIIIMVVVLFFRKGIMGDREFSVSRMLKKMDGLRVRWKKPRASGTAGGDGAND